MSSLLQLLLWLAIALQAAAAGFLFSLAIASLLPRRRVRAGLGRTRFAVVVPAHNEEAMLPATLASIAAQDYDRRRFSVHVIADNCSDATAAVARQLGATVHERHAPDSPGKGQAISWLIAGGALPAHDALVFIDADSRIDASFLATADAYLQRGRQVALQANYAVQDATSSPLVSLRAMAFALMHNLRGRGKANLGLSCGLWGNGMVIRREALEATGWQSFSAVEDAEQHLKLLFAGQRVAFMAEARVHGHMPATFAAARDQQRRWEGGRLYLLRRYARPLVVASFRQGNLSPAVALIELALPPLSLLGVSGVATAALAAAFASEAAAIAGGLALAGLAAYVVIGLLGSGLAPKTYLALAHAPRFILWKLWLYLGELYRRSEPAWTRTLRDRGPAS